MREYEGLFILKADLEKEELSQLYHKVTEGIKKYNGEIIGVPEEWGKKRLAYKVGKHKDGVYYLIRFKMEPGQVAQLNADCKLNESIIRLMFTQPSPAKKAV